MLKHAFAVQPIKPEQTHALRHAVLRPHQRIEEMVYQGDDLPDSLHLGAFHTAGDPDGPVVGVLTLNTAPMPGQAEAGDYQLRGMAVAAAMQGRGVGRLLVQRALSEVATRSGTRIWCNARVSAMGFYQSLGFVTQGEPFEIVPIGPHYVMSVAVHPIKR